MANPNDFLLNTDYEMDKIILVKEGDFTSTAEIAHGLSYTPLVFGVWSTDKNFDSVNTLGWTDDNAQVGYVPVLSVECYATSDKIKLTSAGNTNNQTLYYRIYGFQPDSAKGNAPQTASKANQFILNTDYNYLKLFKSGEFTSPNEEFTHNLGYIPQVMAWADMTLGGVNRIQPLETASEFTDFGLNVTDTKIKAKSLISPGLVNKIYWRIYYDKS